MFKKASENNLLKKAVLTALASLPMITPALADTIVPSVSNIYISGNTNNFFNAQQGSQGVFITSGSSPRALYDVNGNYLNLTDASGNTTPFSGSQYLNNRDGSLGIGSGSLGSTSQFSGNYAPIVNADGTAHLFADTTLGRDASGNIIPGLSNNIQFSGVSGTGSTAGYDASGNLTNTSAFVGNATNRYDSSFPLVSGLLSNASYDASGNILNSSNITVARTDHAVAFNLQGAGGAIVGSDGYALNASGVVGLSGGAAASTIALTGPDGNALLANLTGSLVSGNISGSISGSGPDAGVIGYFVNNIVPEGFVDSSGNPVSGFNLTGSNNISDGSGSNTVHFTTASGSSGLVQSTLSNAGAYVSFFGADASGNVGRGDYLENVSSSVGYSGMALYADGSGSYGQTMAGSGFSSTMGGQIDPSGNFASFSSSAAALGGDIGASSRGFVDASGNARLFNETFNGTSYAGTVSQVGAVSNATFAQYFNTDASDPWGSSQLSGIAITGSTNLELEGVPYAQSGTGYYTAVDGNAGAVTAVSNASGSYYIGFAGVDPSGNVSESSFLAGTSGAFVTTNSYAYANGSSGFNSSAQNATSTYVFSDASLDAYGNGQYITGLNSPTDGFRGLDITNGNTSLSGGNAADTASYLQLNSSNASLSTQYGSNVYLANNAAQISAGTGNSAIFVGTAAQGVTLGVDASGNAPVQLHGVANGTSTYDAVNYSQLTSGMSTINNQINSLNQQVNGLKSGIASTVAMANIPQVDQGKHFSVGMGLGHYDGASALSLGGSIRVNENAVIKGTVAHSFSNSGPADTSTAVGVGAAFSW